MTEVASRRAALRLAAHEPELAGYKLAKAIVLGGGAGLSLTEADHEALKLLRKAGRPVIYIANKADSTARAQEAIADPPELDERAAAGLGRGGGLEARQHHAERDRQHHLGTGLLETDGARVRQRTTERPTGH